jgi:hypothetical protein
MEMFRAPWVEESRFGAQVDLERVATAIGWVALGVLAGGAAIQALLLRSRRPPTAEDERDAQEPDVVLDVPELEVDRITLQVQHLRAHISILAELAELLNISVGVDARLDEVELEIEGVEAEVHLIARLKNVRAILEKALDTIGEHPEILRILARSVSRVVRESLEETLGTLDSALEGLQVGDTVDEALLGRLGEVRAALEEVLERAERGVEGAAPRGALGEGPAGEAPSS